MLLFFLTVLFAIVRTGLPLIVFPVRFLPPEPLSPGLEVLDGISIVKSGWDGYQRDKPVIVVSHGNGHTLNTTYVQTIQHLAKTTGIPVIAWDYPGYGDSVGQSTEHSIDRALDHLVKALGHPDENIIFIGQSIGTGPTITQAKKHGCRAVVLVTPFTSILKTRIPVSIPFLDIWNSEQIIAEIRSPILIIGALHDKVIPYNHSKTLASLARDAELISKSSGHNGIEWIPDVAAWILRSTAK